MIQRAQDVQSKGFTFANINQIKKYRKPCLTNTDMLRVPPLLEEMKLTHDFPEH